MREREKEGEEKRKQGDRFDRMEEEYGPTT